MCTLCVMCYVSCPATDLEVEGGEDDGGVDVHRVLPDHGTLLAIVLSIKRNTLHTLLQATINIRSKRN